jgi:hypothetical protein
MVAWTISSLCILLSSAHYVHAYCVVYCVVAIHFCFNILNLITHFGLYSHFAALALFIRRGTRYGLQSPTHPLWHRCGRLDWPGIFLCHPACRVLTSFSF